MNTMNRCLLSLKTPIFLLVLVLTSLSLTPPWASAQGLVRQFPASALRGVLEVVAPPQILINGQPERLSPGARIKSPANLLVMSGNLVGQRVLVNYLRDPLGLIQAVWLLSPTEAGQKRAGMEPRTNFIFGSDADKPKTDDGKTPFDQLPKFRQQ
jgi:hypothetical protein